MATFPHPVTGVILNDIQVHRAALNEDEAETVKLLRRAGYKLQDIAAMMGTNQARIHTALGTSAAP